MNNKVIGLQDGLNGRNEHYQITGYGRVTRIEAIKLQKQGKLPGVNIIKINGVEYLRDIAPPDKSKIDNINKKKKRG